MMPQARILHVISQVSLGGGARAAITLAKYSARLGSFDHTLLSLRPATPAGVDWARQAAGVAVHEAPTLADAMAAVAEADLVHLHFWNTPDLYAFLRSAWPPARLVVWLHVAGDTAPQVVTPQLAAISDLLVSVSDYTAALPAVRRSAAVPGAVIAAVPDLERLAGLAPRAHAGFNIGYIGTVDFEKMHPDFVALHADLDVPQARIIVCGSGGAYPRLRDQIAERSLRNQFELRGYLDDLRPVLANLDVFGYPLRADNYSGSEQVLREAMAAGVPPVVFPYGGAGHVVTHNVTGLVAADAQAYRDALAWLYRHPAERARLGQNARQEVWNNFGPLRVAEQFNAAYTSLLQTPKRQRAWSGAAHSGAECFIESLGEFGSDFSASLAVANLPACLAAEARIANASPPLASAGAGGILSYRNGYVKDAHLRLWAGLVLHGQGRPALAVGEFKAAAELGLRHWRVTWYQARSAEACSAWALAAVLAHSVVAAAPDFSPAQALAQRVAGRVQPPIV